MKIALVFNKDRQDTTGCYIERALMRRPDIECQHFWTRDASKIPRQFDIYFRIDHGDYEHDLPQDLAPKVFWALDAHLKHPWRKITQQALGYDLVFCALKHYTSKLRAKGINAHWVPFACEPDIHKPCDAEKRYDLGFIGTEGKGYRPRLLNALRKKYPDSFIGRADFSKLHEIYSASKIGLNYCIRHRSSKSGYNMRFFEILASRVFLLTNRADDCGVEELGFENNKHLVIYKTRKHLFRLIDYYLAHPAEREAIAEAGYKLAINRHTYAHRVEKMLELIKNENIK